MAHPPTHPPNFAAQYGFPPDGTYIVSALTLYMPGGHLTHPSHVPPPAAAHWLAGHRLQGGCQQEHHRHQGSAGLSGCARDHRPFTNPGLLPAPESQGSLKAEECVHLLMPRGSEICLFSCFLAHICMRACMHELVTATCCALMLSGFPSADLSCQTHACSRSLCDLGAPPVQAEARQPLVLLCPCIEPPSPLGRLPCSH